jgi:predicted nucleic acid-binding protein
MIILDASAAVELLLATAKGDRVSDRVGRVGESLHAPHLIDLEVTHVLRRWVRQSRIAASRAQYALRDLKGIAIRRYSHDPFLDRIWELRDNASAYDAVYLSLAEELGAPLITCDVRLGRIPGHRAKVEVV